jgi:hypothetical protein
MKTSETGRQPRDETSWGLPHEGLTPTRPVPRGRRPAAGGSPPPCPQPSNRPGEVGAGILGIRSICNIDGGSVTNEDKPADLTLTVTIDDLKAMGQGKLAPMTAGTLAGRPSRASRATLKRDSRSCAELI